MVDKAKKIAAELALENDRTEIAEFLAEYKADPNFRNLIWSTTSDEGQHGEDEDGKDDGTASLHTASEEGQLDAVKTLLDSGADINARNESHGTPLHQAVKVGKLDVVRFLIIERGAEVDPRDEYGWTPLHYASREGHLDISRLLVDHGANVNAAEKDYWTPMHILARNGHLEVVKLLLERDVDLHVFNDKHQTPYQVSLEKGHKQIADILRDHGRQRERCMRLAKSRHGGHTISNSRLI
jgi:ankyrin repeat protein